MLFFLVFWETCSISLFQSSVYSYDSFSQGVALGFCMRSPSGSWKGIENVRMIESRRLEMCIKIMMYQNLIIVRGFRRQPATSDQHLLHPMNNMTSLLNFTL